MNFPVTPEIVSRLTDPAERERYGRQIGMVQK